MPRVAIALLGELHRVAAGGQGIVSLAPEIRLPRVSGLAFKSYKPHALAGLDWISLEAMPVFIESMAVEDADSVLALSAWPLATVDDGGTVVGFLMPAIPEEFHLTMRTASGSSRELSEFQHLLNDADFLTRRDIEVTTRDRYHLLVEVARAMDLFHSFGIAIGDLSPKNLLFAISPTPKVYFIDCDGMRLRGRSVLAQLETPDWDVHTANSTEELATPESDGYKLGLLVLRILVGDQSTRNPRTLPAWVPDRIDDLIRRALSAEPDRRPAAHAWVEALEEAAANAPAHHELPLSGLGFEPSSYGITPSTTSDRHLPVLQRPVQARPQDSFFRRHLLVLVISLLLIIGAVAASLVTAADRGSPAANSVSTESSPAFALSSSIVPITATVYRTAGDPQDNASLAGLAIDGYVNTRWYTTTPQGLVHGGVGLMLMMPGSGTVGSVTIYTDTPGAAVEIRSSAWAYPTDVTQTSYPAGGLLTNTENQFSLRSWDSPPYLLIWISNRAKRGPETSINEVVLSPA